VRKIAQDRKSQQSVGREVFASFPALFGFGEVAVLALDCHEVPPGRSTGFASNEVRRPRIGEFFKRTSTCGTLTGENFGSSGTDLFLVES
jgi:hypothetical protein